MTTKRENPAVIYAPLPPDPDNQNYVVLLPLCNYHPTNRQLRRYLTFSAVLLLLLTAGCLLYPSDPELTLVRLRLNHIELRATSLNLSLYLSLRILNRDFFSLRYSSLDVSVGYRGQNLGHVTSDGGHVRARGTSYVNATLQLDGFQVIHDVFYLIDDLASGSIPFDTDSIVNGKIGLFFIQVPIKVCILGSS